MTTVVGVRSLEVLGFIFGISIISHVNDIKQRLHKLEEQVAIISAITPGEDIKRNE